MNTPSLNEILSQLGDFFKGIISMIFDTKEMVDNQPIFSIREEIGKILAFIAMIALFIGNLFKRRR